MMDLRMRLTPVLATFLVSACGVSSVGSIPGNAPQTETLQARQAAAPSGAGSASDQYSSADERQAALRKVALSLASGGKPDGKSYRIGPLDVLEVTVFKVPELSKTLQVSEAGTINYPLVGEIEAGGKTAREIEQQLTKLLSVNYLQKPQISVFVREHNSQRITVEGAVKRPGVIPIAGGMSLLQAIAQAGGLEEVADTEVALFREVNAVRSGAKYNLDAIRSGKAKDPQLIAGDLIVVPTSDVKQGINMVVKFLPLAQIAPLL